jgi:hypothetical protein
MPYTNSDYLRDDKFMSPEMFILLYTDMHLSDSGLMVLDGYKQFDNEPYYKYYAEEKPRHELFERDMRHICKLLGLELMPDQDFHQKIVFTPESTHKLMQMGMHYTKDHFKHLLQARHCHRLFKSAENQGLPKLPEDLKAKIISAAFPELHPVEVKAVKIK